MAACLAGGCFRNCQVLAVDEAVKVIIGYAGGVGKQAFEQIDRVRTMSTGNDHIVDDQKSRLHPNIVIESGSSYREEGQ